MYSNCTCVLCFKVVLISQNGLLWTSQKYIVHMCFVRCYDYIIHLLIGCGYMCEYDERYQDCTCVSYILSSEKIVMIEK